MTRNNTIKSFSLATGAALVLGAFGGTAMAEQANPFAMTELSQGYSVATAADGKCGTAKCGGMEKKTDAKAADGKCGGMEKKADAKAADGKCGGMEKTADGKAADVKAADGKAADGKCGGAK